MTGAVGIGSFLFHTLANRWSLLADVLPIGVSIYSYFLIAMRRFLGLGGPMALGLTLAFFGFSLVFERLWVAAVGPDRLNGSIGYVPAALAMLAVGATLRLVGAGSRPSARIRARRRAGGALLLAAACFALSLGLRTIDERVCPAMPAGTHMFWHVLNALVLFQLMRSALAFGRTAPPKDPPSFSQDRG